MPLQVKKVGEKYQVREPSGKVVGTHPSRQAAIRQIQAIEIAKRERKK